MGYIKRLSLVMGIMLALIMLVGCDAGKKNNSESQPDASMDSQKSAYFVNVNWLKENLDNVVLLDARGEKDYQKGHIPGAINATWQGFADMEGKPSEPNWGTLLSKEKLAEKLGELGINEKQTVIVYADPAGWGEDGRIVWMLRMAGIEDAKMLDGGWKAWTVSEKEISTEKPVIKPVEFNISSLDDDFNATTDWIEQNQEDIKIVDSRTIKEYEGATDFGEARGGHLANALNIPFGDTFNEDGTVKSTDELKELFINAGLNPEDNIVTYCTAGIRSAHMALLLQMAGFEKARNYDASFYAWAGNPSLKLEK